MEFVPQNANRYYTVFTGLTFGSAQGRSGLVFVHCTAILTDVLKSGKRGR
jgi:hypothetical protein